MTEAPDNTLRETPAPATAGSRWRTWIGRLLLAGCLGWFVWLLARNFDGVRNYAWHFQAGWLTAGLLTLAASMYLLPLGTRLLIGGLGHPIRQAEMNWMYFSSQLAKYLPGSLWGYVGMALYYRQRAVPLSAMTACFLYELILIVVSSLAVGASSILPLLPAPAALAGSARLAAGTAVLLLFPALPLAILGRLPKFHQLREVHAAPAAFARAVRLTFLLDVVFWVLCGGALWMLFRGSVGDNNCTPLELITSFPVAWTAGFLAFIMPGGFGVREGTFVLLLHSHFTQEVATALALLARVQWMLGEWLCVGSAFLIHRIRSSRS